MGLDFVQNRNKASKDNIYNHRFSVCHIVVNIEITAQNSSDEKKIFKRKFFIT
jgi:hypothetical protein